MQLTTLLGTRAVFVVVSMAHSKISSITCDNLRQGSTIKHSFMQVANSHRRLLHVAGHDLRGTRRHYLIVSVYGDFRALYRSTHHYQAPKVHRHLACCALEASFAHTNRPFRREHTVSENCASEARIGLTYYVKVSMAFKSWASTCLLH